MDTVDRSAVQGPSYAKSDRSSNETIRAHRTPARFDRDGSFARTSSTAAHSSWARALVSGIVPRGLATHTHTSTSYSSWRLLRPAFMTGISWEPVMSPTHTDSRFRSCGIG